MPEPQPPVSPAATYAPLLEADRLVANRYRLTHFIARGGMAEVWAAEDGVLGRPVALKLLLPHLAADPAFLERFRREAIAAARLAHPNVVATYDTGVDGRLAFIVMELVSGSTLRAMLTERQALRPEEAVAVAAQVAAALDYAHRCGIVHRDVKPANVLINAEGQVKVADFGIAKAAVDGGDDATGMDLTGTGAVIGTAKYLSPEQIDGRAVDARSDVYALGVVLYEMFCGRPPFVGTTDISVGVQHLSSVPISPRQVRAGIPRPLEAVVLKALAKDPEDRHPSAGHLQAALTAVDLSPDDAVPFAERDDTPARGNTMPAGFARTERHWLVPAVAILVVALALGVGGVLFSRSDTGRKLLGPTDNRPQNVPITSVTAFDPPPGDGQEHNEEIAFLTDGDPATVWSTSNYASSRFGNLKPGVGLVIDLGAKATPEQLEVISATTGWSAEVLAVDGSPPADRPSWGDPVDTVESVDGTVTFDLGGDSASSLLLWFTDLGPSDLGQRNHSVAIGELKLA